LSNKLNTFQRVRELEGWHAVAYAATLIERMQPNYQLFCQVTEYTDPSQFRKTLDLVWEWLAIPKAKINLAVQQERIEDATPDAQDFDNFGVYPAIDAAISLASVLLLMAGDEPQGAVVASKLSQGGVEAFIEATAEAEITDLEIRQHPLMQWEIAFQQELLDMILSLKSGAESVKSLRQMATVILVLSGVKEIARQ
jgi:uncharacterized protein YjaG (DUF416 family)